MFQMLGLLFGPATEDLPHPDVDWPAFEEGLAELLARVPEVAAARRRTVTMLSNM